MWSFQGSFYHLIDFYPGPHPASGREKAWSSTLENFNGTNLGKEHSPSTTIIVGAQSNRLI